MADEGRIVFTAAVGARRYGEMAMGLVRSLSLIGDPTPRAILTDIEGFAWERYFDVVIRASVPREEAFLTKLMALERTGARKILFVDADCLAFKRLAPIFEAFDGAPVGVQGLRISSGSWYQRDIAELCQIEGIASLPKFNSGVLYYERTPDARAVVDEARRVAERYDETGFSRQVGGRDRGAVPDEPCLALAMARTGVGRVVPEVANFQNSGVGLVGPLRLSVRRNECRYLCRRYALEYVEPYIFHAHFYSSFLVYWQQLRALEKLERYEDRHPFGYMSPAHKLSRSVQRRLIKVVHGRHLRTR
jgi:hypothetical protein